MSTPIPPNLPGKENDTGFPMYNWHKRMRLWAINAYNVIDSAIITIQNTFASYVLKASPVGGQTLTGNFTYTGQVNIYSPDVTNTKIEMTSSNAGEFSMYEAVSGTMVWNYDPTTKYLATGALRLVGDFSNSTVANRTSFRSNVANGACHIQAIPVGTSTTATFRAFGQEDVANASVAVFGVNTGTEVRLQSSVTAGGTGTYLPMTFYTNNVESFRIDVDGRISGKFLHNVGTVTGTTQQYIASGTYTPTATNVTNATAGTCQVAKWTRVGNVVSVSGRMALTPTAATTTTVWGLSLPIASNLASTADLNGIVTTDNTGADCRSGIINGDTTNDRANLSIRSATNASENYYYMFQYEVL